MMNVYIAAPIVGLQPEMEKEINEIKHTFSEMDKYGKISFYDPKEHGVPNAWGMSMDEWARCIFALDVVAIDNADWVVVCDYGRNGTAGTAWEAGYAFGKGKKVVIIEMAPVDTDYSVMMRGCCSNYIDKKSFNFLSTSYDNLIKKLFIERGRLAQGGILN